ncbi:MAG: ABC transporter permease [Bacillota bacterium]|nr:ABC transporter permease [Bacillota bacterium]
MINLIKNELIKLFGSKKFYVLLLVLTGFSFVPVIGAKVLGDEFAIGGQSFALTSLSGILSLLLPIFIIIVIADLFAEDYASGTMAVTLIHPITRTKLFNAKLLAVVATIFLLTTYTLVISYLMGITFFSWSEPFVVQGVAFSATNGILFTIGLYYVSILPLAAFAMLIILIISQFSNSGTAVGASIGLFLLMGIAGQIVKIISPFLITTQLNLYAYFLTEDAVINITTALAVIIAYGLISYIVGVIQFNRRDIML